MSIQLDKNSSKSKRGGTRLTPFEKLPRIGSSHEYIPHPPPIQHKSSLNNPRNKIFEKEESILIAIKLSDGRRLQRMFYPTNTIKDIIIFVKSQQIDLNYDFYLSSGDVPKRQFTDFNLTLSQAKIRTRSMEIEKHSSVEFYRKLLNSAKVFLTEVDERSSIHSSNQSEISVSQLSNPQHDLNLTKQLKSTRHECHQRLLTSSRKKLRLLSLQEQNDRRHSTFEKFLNNLDEKRCASIRRYQLELKDYLLQRLQADRLKQQVHLLHLKIQLLNEEKEQYYHIMDIVKKAIPLFPPGLLQGGSDGVKSLLSRYETLVQTKQQFLQRDFSKEKLERRQQLQKLFVQHNIRVAQLNTRIAQLYSKLNSLERNQSMKEEVLINQTDFQRLNMMVKSQIESSISSLYDRYHLVQQTKPDHQLNTIEKLKFIQEFILYRMDLVEKAKCSDL